MARLMSCAAAVVVASLCVVAVAPGSALAAQRVAAPAGTPDGQCTMSSPCDLVTALSGAASGDDVLVESGDYGSPTDPIAQTITAQAANLTVHGPAGGPRPRIFLSGLPQAQGDPSGLVFEGAMPTLRDLEVHNVSTGAGGEGIFIESGTIDHVVASTATVDTGVSPAAAIVAQTPSVITDTVAYATNAASGLILQGLFFQGTGGADVVRNCTFTAPRGPDGSFTYAMQVVGFSQTTTVTIENTIAANNVAGLLVTRSPNGMPVTVIVNADHDAISGEQTIEATYNATDVTSAAPAFVDAATHDYREAATSTATIDQGAPVSAGDPATDLDGDLRTVGSAPDIGADELPSTPSATVTEASGVDTSQATVSGSVTNGGGISRAWLDYGTTTAYGLQTQRVAVSPAAGQQALSFPVTGLAAGTTYHARITVVNQAGTTSSSDATFTTLSPPAPPGSGGGGTSGGEPPISRPPTSQPLPTSPPGPPPPPHPTPASIAQTGNRAATTVNRTGHRIALPVSVICPADERCVATVAITVPAAATARKVKPEAKRIVIAQTHLTLRGGQRRRLVIRLNRTGVRLLRRRHRLTTTFAVTVVTNGAAKSRKSGRLVIEVQARRRA